MPFVTLRDKSQFMIRSSFLWLTFGLLLTHCSSEKSPTVPACSYKSKAQKSIKMSTSPQTVGLPFDQAKLIELLWTDVAQGECFLRQNGGIQLYKISSQNEIQSPQVFEKLKQAPSSSVEDWERNSTELGAPLLGLTTFWIYSQPTEKISRAEIMVVSQARPWHLWHEYTHYLIGLSRMNSKELNLKKIKPKEVSDALDAALIQKDNDALFKKNFQQFSALQIDYIQKAFVDEILIEATLSDLTTQAFDLLPVSLDDLADSVAHMAFYKHQYNDYYQTSVEEIQAALGHLSSEQQDIVGLHLKRLEQNKTNLESILH